MSDRAPQPSASHVDFVEVAGETVHESVEREREITIADDLDPAATEPYAPVDEADVADCTQDTADPEPEAEQTRTTEPSGERVVNAITAAVCR